MGWLHGRDHGLGMDALAAGGVDSMDRANEGDGADK